ncbi:MAG: glycosyltransferase [Chloroflexota bacterium]
MSRASGARLSVGVVVPGWSEPGGPPALPALQDHLGRLAGLHDVRVVTLRHPPDRRSYVDDAGVPVTTMGAGRQGGATGRASVLGRGVRGLWALHRERPFDLLHGFWADEPGAVAVLSGRVLGVPAVVSLMGGELAAIEDIGYGAALGRGGRWTAKVALRGASIVTTGSATLFRSAASVAPGVPLRMVPLGVDLATFHPGPDPRQSSDGPRLLWAGSLTAVKDPVLLLRAFARLPDRRSTLDVAGDGPLRPGLERLAFTLGVANRVRFLGALDRAGLAAGYRAADALVVTSRHEAQSMVVAEGAACGLPVVGTAVGVVPELADASGGVVVTGRSPAELAGAIASVMEPGVRERMGAAAAVFAARRWDLERSVTRWSGLWVEVASAGVRRTGG